MEKEIKKLYRSREDRIIWGVAGGLAKYFKIDSTLMRLILVVFAFITGGLGIIFYIIAAMIVSYEPASGASVQKEANPAGLSEKKRRSGSGMLIGAILFIIGLFALLSKFFSFYWFRWSLAWPVLLMVLGLIIIVRAGRK